MCLRVLTILLGFLSSGALAAPPSPAASPKVIVIRAAQIIDGRGGAPLRPGVVVLRGERIEAVGGNPTIPQGAELIDLGGATLMPGFIDLHTHMTGEVGIHWE